MSTRRYQIVDSGAERPLHGRVYTSREEALRAYRREYGVRAVYLSEWFTASCVVPHAKFPDDEGVGLAAVLYASESVRKADHDGARCGHEPWLFVYSSAYASDE